MTTSLDQALFSHFPGTYFYREDPKRPEKTRKDPKRPEKTRKDPKDALIYTEKPEKTHLFIPRRPEKTREDPKRPEKTRKDPKRHPKRPKKTRKDIFIVDVEWKMTRVPKKGGKLRVKKGKSKLIYTIFQG